MKILGYLCFAFAAADVVLSWTGNDITGVFWSPIVAIVIGNLLVKFGSKNDEEEPEVEAVASSDMEQIVDAEALPKED